MKQVTLDEMHRYTVSNVVGNGTPRSFEDAAAACEKQVDRLLDHICSLGHGEPVVLERRVRNVVNAFGNYAQVTALVEVPDEVEVEYASDHA